MLSLFAKACGARPLSIFWTSIEQRIRFTKCTWRVVGIPRSSVHLAPKSLFPSPNIGPSVPNVVTRHFTAVETTTSTRNLSAYPPLCVFVRTHCRFMQCWPRMLSHGCLLVLLSSTRRSGLNASLFAGLRGAHASGVVASAHMWRTHCHSCRRRSAPPAFIQCLSARVLLRILTRAIMHRHLTHNLAMK